MQTEKKQELVRTKNKGACLPLAQDDLTAIVDTVILCSMQNKGRPSDYPNNEQGLELFNNKTIAYFQYISELNKSGTLERALIPDIENWAMFLGVTRQTIFNYERRGIEWQGCIQYYKNAIASVKKQLALKNKIPPMVYIFDATNNHGYVNTNEFKLTANNNQSEEKDRQELENLERKAQALGLKWNADTQSYE